MSRSRKRLRNRRGAILVWVGFGLTFMLLLSAVVMDVAFWYVGQSELQTAADAAALRGARMLQYSKAFDPTSDVVTATIAFAPKNGAQGKAVTVTADQVTLGWWQPGATEIDLNLNGRPANAVQVETTQPGDNLFGRMFSFAQPTLRRRAVAWVAKINGAKCVKPWALPMPELKKVATNGASSADEPLTPDEILALKDRYDADPKSIMMEFAPPAKIGNPTPLPPLANGHWAGIRFDGENTNTGNQGMAEYRELIGGKCLESYTFEVGDVVRTDLPSGALDQQTAGAVENGPPGNNPWQPLCYYKGTSADCYASPDAPTPGRKMLIAWTSIPVASGTEAVTARMIGEFWLQCFTQKNQSTCDGKDVSSYNEASIIGYVIPNFHMKMAPEYELGNLPSAGQLIVLVK
ncbi:MAG TPA: pilus assembly protein TadG-related protein [Gemmatimonadaceae bacterium]|nr:pilus assembly protein TadG-related protein [Gemmatimonadaceae bacterium]